MSPAMKIVQTRKRRRFYTDLSFQVLVGTSAGALNAAFLAGAATQGLRDLERLALSATTRP